MRLEPQISEDRTPSTRSPMETAGSEPRRALLRIVDHRVTVADVGRSSCVDIEAKETADLIADCAERC